MTVVLSTSMASSLGPSLILLRVGEVGFDVVVGVKSVVAMLALLAGVGGGASVALFDCICELDATSVSVDAITSER